VGDEAAHFEGIKCLSALQKTDRILIQFDVWRPFDWPEAKTLQKHSPTRRAVIAGVAVDPALLPVTTSARESPDARLLELGRQFQAVTQGLESCEWSDDALFERLDAVENEILRVQATTMEGLFVKASAACWALLG
jgi:hypothetical protein